MTHGDRETVMEVIRETPEMDNNGGFSKSTKHAGLADVNDDVERVGSFTYIVIAGVVQKIPVGKPSGRHRKEPSPVRMRSKLPSSKNKPDRRISCKDLGKGDCEGWLFKRKQKGKTLSRHWEKCWCVLKHYSLYCYKEVNDLKAESIIHLQAFQVSPASDIRTRKFAFKIHNSGTTFYFASERQSDMGKWMNKIGLAAINYDASHDTTTSGFPWPGQLSVLRKETKGGYSDSEEEGEDASQTPMFGSMQSLTSISSVDSTSSYMSSVSRRPHVNNGQEVLGGMINSIHHLDLTIDGKDKTRQRQSRCTVTQNLPGDINRAEVDKIRKLLSLQRTLQAKELELQEIESLLKKPVSLDELYRFVETHNLQPQHMQTHL